MPTHKIQSTNDGLTLNLLPVPKMLGKLTLEWAPQSFVVSFKLETDHSLLVYKAAKAISNYGIHLVIANMLQVCLPNCFANKLQIYIV